MKRRTLLQQAALASLPLAAHAGNGFEATPWPAGLPAPALKGPDLAGQVWDLAALKGRAVLVNFWATWCEPCRAELPSMQQLAELHGPERLVVLCVNVKEPVAKVRRFVAATDLRLPVLLDGDGQLAKAWAVRIFPTTVLVGTDGRPRLRLRGEVDWASTEARRLVAPLLPPAAGDVPSRA